MTTHPMADSIGVASTGNLATAIADSLGERIIRGELRPGYRLLEVQLAGELRVSRGPLREALRILEGWRLVRIMPRRGALVTSLGPDDVRCLYEVVTPLYQTLTRGVALNWTPDNLPGIYTVVEQMVACAEEGDAVGYYEHNFTFARACAPIVANPMLDDLLAGLVPGLRRVLYCSLDARARTVADHLEIMRAMMRHVMEREADEAAAAVARLADLEAGQAIVRSRGKESAAPD